MLLTSVLSLAAVTPAIEQDIAARCAVRAPAEMERCRSDQRRAARRFFTLAGAPQSPGRMQATRCLRAAGANTGIDWVDAARCLNDRYLLRLDRGRPDYGLPAFSIRNSPNWVGQSPGLGLNPSQLQR